VLTFALWHSLSRKVRESPRFPAKTCQSEKKPESFPLSEKGSLLFHGKLERTAFLLEYFRDAALRRRILIGLNKGEALHSLARQLFFGRLGELRDRALEDQIHRASCLHLLIAAIAAWNTIYLTEAFATLRRQGEEISETTIAHIAPC
jgi:TnpA family transposase